MNIIAATILPQDLLGCFTCFEEDLHSNQDAYYLVKFSYNIHVVAVNRAHLAMARNNLCS